MGEPGCGGLRLGLKNEGVLEGRFEGAFNHGKKDQDCGKSGRG